VAQKISENTEVKLDLKTIGMIIGFTISLATMWFTLKSDIALAMERPVPQVTATEFQYKDEIIRNAIMDTQEDVKEMKELLSKLDARVYELTK
jgi:hypothetical protein